MKHKGRKKEKPLPDPGTFRYGWMMRQKPKAFTQAYYERLKAKREEKRKMKMEEKKHG